MARATRFRPRRLAGKLRRIRLALGLSQNQIVKRMGLEGELMREEISDFERGKRVPPPIVLLQYARAANVYVDVLLDDQLDLPAGLPSGKKREGLGTRGPRQNK